MRSCGTSGTGWRFTTLLVVMPWRMDQRRLGVGRGSRASGGAQGGWHEARWRGRDMDRRAEGRHPGGAAARAVEVRRCQGLPVIFPGLPRLCAVRTLLFTGAVASLRAPASSLSPSPAYPPVADCPPPPLQTPNPHVFLLHPLWFVPRWPCSPDSGPSSASPTPSPPSLAPLAPPTP